MKTTTDGPRLWTHKIEEWRTVPQLPIRISTHGKLERVRTHSFGISKKVLAPIDQGSLMNYVFKVKDQFYSFAAHKLVADAFIGPPAIGKISYNNGNYKDISIWNLTRNWINRPVYFNIPREVAYFILKVVKQETNLYDFYFNKDLDLVKQEFNLSDEEIYGVLDTSLKELDNYETAFDKFNTYSPFIEQYYWTCIKYLNGKGFPTPPIFVRNLTTWNGIQSCLQFVEKDIGKARLEWSNQIRERFPELWSGIIT
jgi:hypothetical protein